MDLKTKLQQLYERHETDIGEYAWLHESDRWAELIFCLLSQYNPQNSQAVRMAVDALQYLGLLETDKLALLETAGNDNVVVFAYILKQHGFSAEKARQAIELIAQVGRVMQKNYGGKIQRYLRRQGEIMRDELSAAFESESLKKEQLRYAIAHWLQNALSLPISLEHQALVKFCQDNGVNLEKLLHAADELDLNIALLDDLLELDQKTEETKAKDQTLEERMP